MEVFILQYFQGKLGVTLSFLWEEYCTKCETEYIPIHSKEVITITSLTTLNLKIFPCAER